MKKVKLSLNNLEEAVRYAAEILEGGGLVAYPTDTVYGLAGHIRSTPGMQRLIKVKNSNAPMPVVTNSMENAERIGNFNSVARRLAELFWPGPLTLIVKGRGLLPDIVERDGKVAIRVPDHVFPQRLARELGGVLVSTSASPSGANLPVSSDEVERVLKDKIDLLVDDGMTKYRGPSTVIDTTVTPPRVTRLGVLSPDDISSMAGIKISL